jgi:prepilin peptidase CpaA
LRDGPSALAFSAATALLLFIVLLIAFSRGLLGGGDVKLMTALAIALPPLDSYYFTVATAVAGGVLAVATLVLSRLLPAPHTARRRAVLGRVAAIESWRIRRRGPLPYGVAIAAGGAFALLHPGGF